jgi:lipopolysaccharide biosynthesis protein
MKIAVCVHLYHIDMLDEIRLYLNNIQREYDLYVSLTKNYPQRNGYWWIFTGL